MTRSVPIWPKWSYEGHARHIQHREREQDRMIFVSDSISRSHSMRRRPGNALKVA